MVIFTSNEMLPLVKHLRNARSLIVCKSNENCFPTVIIKDFNSPWEMPPIKRVKDMLLSQINIDPEKHMHSSDLYAVWNAKPWMLEYAVLKNPFNTRYFLWIDAGAFRNTHYRFGSWSDQQKAIKIFEKDGPEKLLLGLINRLPEKLCANLHNHSTKYNVESGPIARGLIQGAIIGGSSESIRWWSKLYYNTIDLYIKRGWFVGKDQNIMNSLAFAHPKQIHVILAFKLQCDDPWFAFGPLFANYRMTSNRFGKFCQSENV